MSINLNKKDFKLSTFTFLKLIAIYMAIGLIVRIVLLFSEHTQIPFLVSNYLQIFLLGAVNDLCAGIVALFFMWLCIIFMSQNKYKKPYGYIILGIIAVALGYVTFFNTIFHDYGSVVPDIVRSLLIFKFISFAMRLFVPKVRKNWSLVSYYTVLSIYLVCILMNAISEYFFWDEFGVRYNFIAVDYLIYTNEVVGNILESYPILPLFAGLLVIAGIIEYLFLRKERNLFDQFPSFISKTIISAVYFSLVILACVLLKFNVKFQKNENVYVNELQANGMFKFYTAFMDSKLDYSSFYTTLPNQEAFSIINAEYNSVGKDNLQTIKDSLPEVHKNIVLITVESLSASFMKHYGNENNLTPNLDKLMDESIAFNNMFATGNRTVRGLEAVTLSLPPSAGESIIKQPNNGNLFSTGKILKEKGYTVQYFYGGDSYFDNMETFFGGNGYDIIDKKILTKDQISFSNIWGVCDEDMFNKAIEVFTANSQTDKPFFGHIMTVSNHRPFTYPDGKIDIPASSKSREGGVKYTDYALGQFIEKAKKQEWFKNTIFVIIADHCASSSGKTEIPLEKYHIPALIYAPNFIQPKHVDMLVSQIDIMPTLFGLLHFSYQSHFYGKDIFSPTYKSRAFIATYQNLGYLENDVFTVLSPTRKVEQYAVSKNADKTFNLNNINKIDSTHLKSAIANYQTASYINKNKK